MRKFLLIIGCAFLSIFSGCQYSANADRFLTTKPTIEEVIGDYQLYEQTVSVQLDTKKVLGNSRVRLNKDGTCELLDYPDWKEDESGLQGAPQLLNLVGTFITEKVGMVSGFPDDQHCFGPRISVPGRPDIYMNFATGKNGIELVNEYGDPDQWHFTLWSRLEKTVQK